MSPPPQVTLLQAARNPGEADNFTFLVDETVTDPRVHITGRSVRFTVISPTGMNTSLYSLLHLFTQEIFLIDLDVNLLITIDLL